MTITLDEVINQLSESRAHIVADVKNGFGEEYYEAIGARDALDEALGLLKQLQVAQAQTGEPR